VKNIKCISCKGWVLAVSLLFSLGLPASGLAKTENHCFTCHTNPRKLVEITREIARADQGRPGASIETEGEG
jgi:hypothetical protein